MTKPTTEQILEANTATQAHINLVRQLLRVASTELLIRGEVHDQSKFSPEEVEMYAVFTPRLRGMTYNSDDYRACLKEMGTGLQHHYANNRHHPEHFPNGIRDMNLIDVLEMMIDWLASSKRHADGNILKSIDANQKRFGMSDELAAVFRNTAKLLAPTDLNADLFLHEFKQRIGREIWVKPHRAERDIIAFVWVLDVPKEQLGQVEDEAIDLALSIFGSNSPTFLVTVADPEKSAQLRAGS